MSAHELYLDASKRGNGPGRSAEFYHGTNAHLAPGDEVISARAHHLREGRKWLDPDNPYEHEDLERESEHLAPTTFMTTKPEYARTFGKRVYKVTPTGRFWDDHAEHTYEVDAPLRVLGEHQVP